jgi:4-amino-4-deoxy-L-arabinose transferase-like glycosyltransferase
LNLALGLTALAAAGLLLYLAFRLQRLGRPVEAALAIAAAGLALRLYAGCDLFLHTWDERFHALVAKHLAEHPLVPTLYEHPVLAYDFRNWRANHVWLHKPPLALWLMAASIRVLGADEIALRLPGLLLSTVAIFLTCVIGFYLCGRRAGLLAGAFQAVNGYLLQLPAGRVAVDQVDNALVFFVELGIFFAVLQTRAQPSGGPAGPDDTVARRPQRTGRQAGWLTWGGLAAVGASVGLAVLAKWLPGLLPVPVWLALAWRRQPRGRIAAGLTLILSCAAAVVLPWQLYIRRAFPLEAHWEASYNLRHLFVPVEGLGGSPLFHLERMPRYFGELIYLPVVWLLVLAGRGILAGIAAKRARRSTLTGAPGEATLAGTPGEAIMAGTPGESRALPPQRALPWLAPIAVWLLLPYVAFSLAATKLGGYIMVAAPALFLTAAAFWCWLWDSRARVGLPAGSKAAFAAAPRAPARIAAPTPAARRRALETLRWTVLVLLPLLPLRYTLERLKVRSSYDRNPPWVRALRALPAALGPGPVVIFHLDQAIEAMFYTPYTAYEEMPTPAQARRLLDSGYRVVVLDAGAAPPSLRAVAGIELRREAIPPSPINDGTGFRRPRADGSDSPLAGTLDAGTADTAGPSH